MYTLRVWDANLRRHSLALPRGGRRIITLTMVAQRDWRGSLPYDGAMRMFRLNFRVAGTMRLNQSAAAVAAGFCFIISSIPFFISFVEGSALWVPTIQL